MRELLLILLAVVFLSCQGDSQASFESASADQPLGIEKYEDSLPSEVEEQDITERKVIRTAEIRLLVKDLSASAQRIEAIAKENEGFVSSVNQSNSSYSINNTMTIRVPSEKLEAFLAAVEQESVYTDYKRISSQDVTEEYVDISSRLEAKKEVRDRYMEILRTKAETVEDILEAEARIGDIQEEIESIEGRLRYLNNQTALSTVTVDLYQKVEYVQQPEVRKRSFGSKLKGALADGWDLVSLIAIGIVTIWPLWVLIAIGLIVRRRIRRRREG